MPGADVDRIAEAMADAGGGCPGYWNRIEQP